jgi:hypothetical protein
MATRTRNMEKLHYFSNSKCVECKYKSISDCEAKLYDEFKTNISGLSTCNFLNSTNDNDEFATYNETDFFHLYTYNSYYKDYYKSNTTKYFENEIIKAGFNIIKHTESYRGLCDSIKQQMDDKVTKISDDKFDALVEFINDEDNSNIPKSINSMLERVKLIGLNSVEMIHEYRDIIQDEHKFEHVMNYLRLSSSLKHCEEKFYDVASKKMFSGIHNNTWNKILYLHNLAKEYKMKDVLDIEGLQAPKGNSKKLCVLIDAIKKLYNKRDSIDTKDYSAKEHIKLYKTLLANLIGKLGLIETKRLCTKEKRDVTTYVINPEMKARYDKLINKSNYNFEEEE